MHGTIDGSLLGNEAQQKYLEGIIQCDKVNHAYLFLGPRHCGGTSLMRIFASAVKPAELIDLHAIDNENKSQIITVKQIQELCGKLSFTAYHSGVRVVCIPDASQLTDESSNALLKILEEPPPQTIFLMRAIAPGDIYPTILSRCAIIRLHQSRIDEKTIRTICSTASDATLKQAVRLSFGRIGTAIQYCSDEEARSSAQLRFDARSSYASMTLGDRLQACGAFSSVDIEEWLLEIDQTLMEEYPISSAIVSWYQALIAIRKDLGKSLRDQSAWTAFCLRAEPCILKRLTL